MSTADIQHAKEPEIRLALESGEQQVRKKTKIGRACKCSRCPALYESRLPVKTNKVSPDKVITVTNHH